MDDYYIGDFQSQALFGDTDNPSVLTANMLNPAASGPDDWATVLTNGISGAAVNGINGMIGNAVARGQLQNIDTAQRLGVMRPRMGGNIMPLLLIGALIILAVR